MSLSNIRVASLVAGALLLGPSYATKTVILTAILACDAPTSPTNSGSLSVSTQGPLTLSSTSLLSSSKPSVLASTTQGTSPAAVVSTPSQTTLITRTKASSATAVPRSSSSRSKEATTSSAAGLSSRSSSAASSSSAAAAPTVIVRAYPADIVDRLRDSSISKLETYLQRNPSRSSCTLENASIRREWSDLSAAEREEYTAAVKCLQSARPKSSRRLVPGARSRFDDFVATHINQTDSIHNTANFLSWHRYYVWTYEKALREECGYRGFQPYWNWDRYAADPANSPLFNGNASSMSGNSKNGGCVTSGPFANMRVNLGPGSSLSYNPRCLKRDISKMQAAQTTADKTYALITRSANVASLQNTMQGIPGVHAGGHFTIGGDPGSDIHASSGDPAFYLHHAMIDRVWWIWQTQNLSSRLTEVAGSVAGSWRQGTAKDFVDLGVNAGAVTIHDLLDTMGGLNGQMCYIYF